MISKNCFSVMEGFVDSNMATKYNSPLSRGYGVVTFDTETNAQKLLEKNITLFDRELRFSIYDDKRNVNNTEKKYEKSYKIYVAHPTSDINEETLRNIFSPYGTINVLYTKTDVKGQQYSIIGFVERESLDKVLNIKLIYDGVEMVIRPFKRRNRRQYNNYNNNDGNNYRSYPRNNRSDNRRYDGQRDEQYRRYNGPHDEQYNRRYNNQPGRSYNGQYNRSPNNKNVRQYDNSYNEQNK